MGFSPFLNECQAEGYWPIGPACDKIFSFGIYLFFSVVNFIILSLSNVETSNYTRIDSSLSIHIILAICSVFAVICQSIFYLVIDFFFNSYSPLILAFCISKLTFWLICLASLAKYRSVKINMAISLSTATVLSLVPMTAWHKHFPPKQSNKIDFVFYIIELVLVVAVFTFSMITPLLSKRNQNSQSAWTNFSRKLVMVAPYVWPKKSVLLQLRVVICFLLLIIGRLINVALPVYSKWIIDDLSTPDQFHYSLIFIATGLKFLQGSGSMGGFLNTLRTFLWIPIQQYTTRELEVELFSHLHSLSMRWHLSRKTGQVLRVMDRGTSSINNILNYILFNVVPTIADIFIAVIFFLSNFNFYFGCIIFITMAIYMGVTIWITEWRTKFLRESNEKDNSISALATDSLLNYETVKYYGNEDYEVNRFRESIESFQILAWKSQASLGLLNFLQNGIIGIGLALGSFFIVYLVTVEKTLTIGDYVLFTTYILQLYTPLNFFGTIYRVVQKSFVDMENMFDLMSEEVEVKDLPNAIEYKPTEGKITVRNMSFEYNPNQPVLKNISFEISTGQTVAFVGPSGSGKSTIIRLLFRLFDPVDGDIEFDNIKVNEMTMKSLRKQIGIVPQDTVLFNDTIKYNIRFGRTDATDEEVIEAAKAAMIHEKIISLPEGYDTLVGERGLRLSGGEKQRVAIARTILKKPQFIFLDEATSALDTHTEKAIQKCLEKLCKTKTGVVVAHRLSTIVNADLIVVLEKGEILEAGNHRQLLEKKGTYASMWEAQITEQKEKSIDIISPSSSPIP